MVYVILRSGKVLQYNQGHWIRIEDSCLSVLPRDNKYLVARFPLDVVERAEFEPPCRTLKTKPISKRNRYAG